MSFASMHNDYLDPDRHMIEHPCDVCGAPCDACVCPECPTCNTHGDPSCYTNHGLVLTKEQIETRGVIEQADMEQRQRDAAYANEIVNTPAECPWCGCTEAYYARADGLWPSCPQCNGT
ncbi:MAG TPA: hypothetical protein VF077_01015 [Nitrospiraceae bacterium]